MLIGIDFDGVMNNMVETWVAMLNDVHGLSVQVSDIKSWEMKKAFPKLTEDELFAPLHIPEFWDKVTAKHEAPEVVAKLIADGHRVYVVTTTHYNTLEPKLTKCLFKHFPFLSHHNVIITYNKSLINCDLLLDDAEHNLIDFKGIRVLFDATYNKTATSYDYRVSSWKEFYILVCGLESRVFTPPARVYRFSAGRGQGKTAWLHQMIKDSEGFDCFLIDTRNCYEAFCKSFMKRFGQRCPAQLLSTTEDLKNLKPGARIFVDMPSQFAVNSEIFTIFKDLFLARNYLIFVADYENVNWYVIHSLDRRRN